MRHPTHPSEQCECATCELEHIYLPSRIEFAVNPHTQNVVTIHPIDGSWRVTAFNHDANGRTMSGWQAFRDWADAFEMFWQTAEYEPAQ
jgi:hypothetical protein